MSQSRSCSAFLPWTLKSLQDLLARSFFIVYSAAFFAKKLVSFVPIAKSFFFRALDGEGRRDYQYLARRPQERLEGQQSSPCHGSSISVVQSPLFHQKRSLIPGLIQGLFSTGK